MTSRFKIDPLQMATEGEGAPQGGDCWALASIPLYLYTVTIIEPIVCQVYTVGGMVCAYMGGSPLCHGEATQGESSVI